MMIGIGAIVLDDVTMEVFEFMQKHQDQMLEWDESHFGAFICMAMEEWCRKNRSDVVEFSKEIAEMVEKVNRELGKYE